MMAAEYIRINGSNVYRPPDFQIQREDVYAGELTTCTGKLIADRVGWRYADMTLSWDALPESMVQILVAMSGTSTLQFADADGTTRTENVIRSSAVYLKHRDTINGVTWWKGIEVSLRFIDTHN